MASITVKEAQALVSHMLGHRAHRESRWRELKRWICPTRGLFDSGVSDFEDKQELVRFTHASTSALMRGASGMTSGMTPRNIAWFRPDFAESALIEAQGARTWLDITAQRMRDCLGSGGFYQAIQAFNIDLLAFGCGLLYAEKAEDTPLHFETCQVGSFCVETDRHGRLSAVARKLQFTCHELAGEFGENSISPASRAKLGKNPWEKINVWHLCRENRDNGPDVDSFFWEEGASDFLRQSFYHEMPFFYTCWHDDANIYGTGPGDAALPDAMQIDELERRKLEGIAKITDPPVQIPTRLKDWLNLGPGGINHVEADSTIRPILDLSPYSHSLPQLREEIATVSQRLEQTLYAAIFTSMPLDQRPRDMSATEFLERKREALQQLGPVISAYEPNVLTPMLYRVLLTLDRRGLMPPAPRELAGYNLTMKMEFISPMANALRQTDAQTTRALFQDVAMIAQATQNPEVLDKIDTDQMVDELATDLGCLGSIVRSDDEVAQIRQQRQAAQMQQAQMQAQMQQAQAEETAGKALKNQAEAAQTAKQLFTE